MSLHKLTAGNGYTYLTRQVAAADATDLGHTSLGDFYAQKGESPGVWVGSGLSGLDGVDAGSHVSGEQMLALFGEGRHPNADSIGDAMIAAGHGPAAAERASALGRRYPTYDQTTPLRVEVARAFAEHNTGLGQPRKAPIPPEVRARIRTDAGAQMFSHQHGRAPADSRELHGFIARSWRVPTAVAGFDLTFSPVKSVSALWALAPPVVAAAIQQAQSAAVADTLRWLEREAAFTRLGTGRDRPIRATALIGTAFTHRDARSGDPDLHTHVAISNKVQSAAGTWLSLYSPVLFKAHVSASERYDTRIEAELSARLGVRFQARPTADPSRRPVREVVGVDPRLNQFWSSRRADIEVRLAILSAAFQVDHARPPTAKESRRLAQQATLATRPAKHSPRSMADQRATWSAQANRVLGGRGAVQEMITAALPGPSQARTAPGQAVTGRWVGETAAQVVATVSTSRPTWQMWHVRAEAERRARAAELPLADLDGAVDRVVAEALSCGHAVPVGEPKRLTEADDLRRDGSSVYAMPGVRRFTSVAAGDLATSTSAANESNLSPAPSPLRREIATSGAPVHPASSPTGSGRAMGEESVPQNRPVTPSQNRDLHPDASPVTGGALARSGKEAPRGQSTPEVEGHHEALFHAAERRRYAPGPDLDAIDTDRQLAEANRWDHATVARTRLLELNEKAADFFTAGYADSWGPGYVSGRLGADLADHRGFRAGYAPAGWTNLTDYLHRLGAGDDEILAAGLGRLASTGRVIDQFRDRLVLPIRNGDAIHGFIGRRNPTPADADNTGPKYLNTAHTDLFDKGAQLFGLSEGRAALDAGATPVLVEGSFDAIAVTLAGADRYVGVAPLGTSLTADQANQLRPYIGADRPGVSVATDADPAGQIGAQRAFWMLTARGDAPRLVAMPDGQDPAGVLQHAGPTVLWAALIDAQPLARLLLQERLTHAREQLQGLYDCATVIAAQPPHTWMEEVEFVAARSNHRPDVVRKAVADAAQRWTLDPLGRAQEQIGELAAVRSRLQRAAHAPRSADRQSGEPDNSNDARPPAGTTTKGPLPPQAWRELADSIDPRFTADQDWPVLARAIQEADAAGCDVAGEVRALATQGRLAGEHAATELAYRLRAATQTFNDIQPTRGPERKRARARSGAGTEPDTATSRRPTSPPAR
jgi:DNA primase catalytic core